MTTYHLAQINIALPLAPLDSEQLYGFVSRIDEINAIAEKTAGFIWRLKGEADNALALRVFEDDRLIINMSVWENFDALYNYTYYSDHAQVYRQKGGWMEKLAYAHMCLWWQPAGQHPTAHDGRVRLEYFQKNGATPYAFTFKTRFTPIEAEEFVR
ncbi:MAG TPA: DUF3291 domain-containing protein [Aggregatilineales bacterium]|nr:DUF3291 domain-containing protein [Aggregatilineales bacterium]